MFPQRLRLCRKDRGLSLKELASFFGMSHSTLSKYETGSRHPDPDMLIKLASFFDISVDYLLGLSDIRSRNVVFIQYSSASGLPPEAMQELDQYIDYLHHKYCAGS